MLTKQEVNVGDKIVHKFLGTVFYSPSCKVLDLLSTDPTTLHIEYCGWDTREVSIALCSKGE